jgi:hypothetical protein
MSAAMQVKAMLGDDPDERLLADALEGSSDVMELLDRLIERSNADAALVRAGKERLARIDARNERTRTIIARMLEALDLRRLERPLATLTLADARRGVVITDEDELPPAFVRTAPDKAAILSALNAGEVVPGAALSNGAGPTLRITTR